MTELDSHIAVGDLDIPEKVRVLTSPEVEVVRILSRRGAMVEEEAVEVGVEFGVAAEAEAAALEEEGGTVAAEEAGAS